MDAEVSTTVAVFSCAEQGFRLNVKTLLRHSVSTPLSDAVETSQHLSQVLLIHVSQHLSGQLLIHMETSLQDTVHDAKHSCVLVLT